MKCLACDRILTELEDAMRFAQSGHRVGLCAKCVIDIPSDIPITGSVHLPAHSGFEWDDESQEYVDKEHEEYPI